MNRLTDGKSFVACFVVLVAAFIAGPTHAQKAPSTLYANQVNDLALHRADSLTRGVNLSGWFGGWGDYSPEHTSTFITAADLTAIHAMGFRYVRFPLDPILLTRGGLLSPSKEDVWKRIDDALDATMNAGLSVDFVVFPRDDYKQQLATQKGFDEFVMLWQVLAKHLAGRDPNRFFFELMNESEVQDPYRWIGIQSAVIQAIRQIDTQHTILASGAHYDSIPDLLETEPVRDANVIYTFHFYEPYPFTHQGATWGSVEWNYYSHIPYPALPEQIAPILPTIPDQNARYQLYQYGQGNWNAGSISQRLTFVAAWAHDHGVPVICNEFGAFRDTAPADSRTRYLHDVRAGLEENGLGWAMWDWSGSFGLVKHSGGAILPDAENVRALGLTAP